MQSCIRNIWAQFLLHICSQIWKGCCRISC